MESMLFIDGHKESRRADSNRFPAPATSDNSGLAEVCKSPISRGLSLLRIAACCTVLRSRWYQNGINRGMAPSRFCSPAARTRSMSSTSPGTPAKSSPSTATLIGCPRWAGTLPTGWTRRWARRTTLAPGFPSVVARVHTATTRRGQAADSPLPRSFRRCSTHPGLSPRAA
jgi:hypothetical protein